MNDKTTLSRQQKKILFLSSLGGVLEFYDFIVYIYLTNVIEKLFFPTSTTFIATLQTLAIFSIGYLLRPLGGIIFSHFGDKYGRKKIFLLTVLLMALPSFAIALLPTAASIGIMAPILLVIFRMIQGLALGGEIPGAITFVSEHVNTKSRGFATATLFFGINTGLLLGSLITAVTAKIFGESLYTYGWRLPFLIGGLFGLLAVYLRRHLQETTAFSSLSTSQIKPIPFLTLFKSYKSHLVLGSLLVSLAAVTVFFFLYWPHYLSQYMGMPLGLMLNLNTISIFIFNISIVVSGWLADRYGYLKIYAIGAFSILILAYPLFKLFELQTLFFIAMSYVMFSTIFGLITGSYPAVLSELFSTPVRYSGIAATYNIAYALFGGLSPIICTVFIHASHSNLAPAYYLMLMALLGLSTATLTLFWQKKSVVK